MSELKLTDVTQKKPGKKHTLASPEALAKWVAVQRKKPIAFWDLAADLFSARFALGDETAGGVMIASPDGEGPYQYLIEGEADGEELRATCDGYEMPIPSLEVTTPDRLLEVLTHLMENGEVGPGKWEGDEDLTKSELHDLGAVDPGMAAVLGAEQAASKGPPQATGHYSKALMELMRARPKRKEPLAAVLGLISKAGDANLRAYLDAFARHQISYAIDCGDWTMATPELRKKEIFIGATGGGDHYLMRGRKAIVVLHETGEEETYLGLEGLISDLVFRAHDRGNATDLDAITGEEPY